MKRLKLVPVGIDYEMTGLRRRLSYRVGPAVRLTTSSIRPLEPSRC